MELKDIVCANVKRLRLEKGYSVRKFASLVGVDEWHTLCDWVETLPYSELITGKGVHV